MKYIDLAEILKKNIENGLYHEDGKLPTEDKLMAEYNVTRYCVRNAINILIELGFIYPVQGSGIFVRGSKREGCLTLIETKGLQGEFGKENVKTKVISLKIVEADEKLTEKFKCKNGTPIYEVVRLRIVKGDLFAVEYAYYNKDIIYYLNNEIAEDSIYSYIKNDLKLNFAFADKIISCEKLDKEASTLLNLKVGEPALIIEDECYLSNGDIFNVSRVVYNYKYAKLFSLVKCNN